MCAVVPVLSDRVQYTLEFLGFCRLPNLPCVSGVVWMNRQTKDVVAFNPEDAERYVIHVSQPDNTGRKVHCKDDAELLYNLREFFVNY